MKHYIKFFAAFFAVLSLLVFTGCPDPMETHKGSGLRITINDDMGRTIFPSSNFTSYVLSFENTDGSETYQDVDVDIYDKLVEITDLPNGAWKITATGFVTINGDDYPAADGYEEVVVTDGEFENIHINISAKKSGDPGFFTYDIGFPASVEYASVYIFDVFYEYWDNSIENIDILSDSKGTVELSPGYYMMSVRLGTSYRTVAWTEVIHIYSNMETEAKRIFTEYDLTKLINIGGTANVTVGGYTPDYVYLDIYKDDNYSDFYSSVSVFEGSWSLSIPTFESARTFYIELVAEFGGITYKDQLENIVLHNVDVNYPIINKNFDANFITLSGSVNFTLNGDTPNDAWLNLFHYNGISWNWVNNVQVDLNDNTYSFFLDDNYLYTWVHFSVSLNDGNDAYVEHYLGDLSEMFELDDPVFVHDLELHLVNKVVLEGTVNYKINDNYPVNTWLRIYDEWNDLFYETSVNSNNGYWQTDFYVNGNTFYDFPVDIWLYFQDEDDWYLVSNTALFAEVNTNPVNQINKTFNIDTDPFVSIRDAFITNENLYLESPPFVTQGDMLVVEIADWNYYSHDPVKTYTWIINGVVQDATTEVAELPTTGLSGRQNGLVIVTIDGAAFAKEFSFTVIE